MYIYIYIYIYTYIYIYIYIYNILDIPNTLDSLFPSYLFTCHTYVY